MNLEGIILSEISKTEKDTCCIISLMCETSKVTSGKTENPVFFHVRDYYNALNNKPLLKLLDDYSSDLTSNYFTF